MLFRIHHQTHAPASRSGVRVDVAGICGTLSEQFAFIRDLYDMPHQLLEWLHAIEEETTGKWDQLVEGGQVFIRGATSATCLDPGGLTIIGGSTWDSDAFHEPMDRCFDHEPLE